MNNLNSINFNEGTVSFRIPKGSLNYKDNKFFYLINYEGSGGILKIYKDIDNGIKVYYAYKRKGYGSLNTKADELDDEHEHLIDLTWSLNKREIILYIDGEKRDSCKIKLEPIETDAL